MSYRIIFFLLPNMLIMCLMAQAQNFEKINDKIEFTHNGTIIFDDDNELDCEFTYNPFTPEGMLLVKAGDQTEAYGVTRVKSFSFYDEKMSVRRYFYSLPINDPNDHSRRKYFIELIHGNKMISILGRATVMAKVYSYYNVVTSTRVFNDYKKYLLDHRNSVIYSFSKREILNRTADKKEEIKRFIKDRKLRLSPADINEYIDLIEYYSSLK